ncbi:FUSC family protein [Mumia quercus]|uniref:FUSC family protein n=1 Tax=Mumia quercus TaxID=2976125 RepID=UPI0021CFACB6|nr:FUSC family protein [Mumia quercus]
MDIVWIALGAVILGATLLDVFLTALNYDEAGIFSGAATRWQWRILRRITRRLSRRWRPVGLRQVTGIQIITVIVLWVFGIITGFGLIYYGLMSRSSFSVSGEGAGLTLFDAFYFSAAQLSTVGGSSLTAETDLLRFLSIAETLSGVVLISLILTFLLAIYSVFSDLNGLCRYFFTAERGAGSTVATLTPFFRNGQPNGLDTHLDGISGSFASYTDGVRLHHAAYYFQSGRDQFALPYAIRMLAGTLGALRWGLPTGHPAAADPSLISLTFQFLQFGEYLQRSVGWRSRDVPEVVSAETFAKLARDPRGKRENEWVAQFLDLDAAMARLAEVEPLADMDDTYRRYSEWLPFAYRAQQITLGVSADLDYQPAIVSDEPVSMLHDHDTIALENVAEITPLVGRSTPKTVAGSHGSHLGRWWARRDLRHSQVDPGYSRFRAAARSVLAAATAALLLYGIFEATGRSSLSPAIFGGFVGMLSAGISADRTPRAARLTSALIIVPVAVVVMLGALVSGSVVLTGVFVVVVAMVGVWAGRFGPRWAALGQVTFMAYYFALILRLQLTDVALYLTAAAVGVASAYLFTHVLLRQQPLRALRSGLSGFAQRLVSSMDTLFDAVSAARWDPDIRRNVSADIRQLRSDAAFVAGQVSGDETLTGVSAHRATALRLRLFDTELAAMNLVAAAHSVTGTMISLELRARLAGRVELLQAHLAQMAVIPGDAASQVVPSDAQLAPWRDDEPAADWPRAARLVFQAANELHGAASEFRATAVAALDPSAPVAVPLDDEEDTSGDVDRSVATPPSEDPPRGRWPLSPPTRRAIQTAVATGAALTIGEVVSASHQYWAALAAYQVLGGTNGETFLKGAQRVAGTVAGAAVGFGLALSTGADPRVVLPLLAVAVFGSTYYRPVAPAVSTFWTTMIFAVLYEFLGRLTTLALEMRILETLFGAAIALVVAALVLPTRTRNVLSKDATTVVKDVDAITSASLGRLAGNHSISKAAIRQRLLAAEQHVRALESAFAPLRLAPGAVQVGGVEARLTAVWALMFHTRQLVAAVESAIDAGVDGSSEDWDGLSRTLSKNATALTTALDGKLPGPVDPDVGGDDTDPSSATAAREQSAVLRELGLVNDTLLVMIEDVSPGAVNDPNTREPVSA